MSNLKFYSITLVALLSIVGILLGGYWMWTGFAFIVITAGLGDLLMPRDTSNARDDSVWTDVSLYLNLPLLLLVHGAFIWRLTGTADSFAIQASSSIHYLGGFLTIGVLNAVSGTNVAHELVHRIRSKGAQRCAKLLSAFTLDGAFIIAHIYLHHRKVGLHSDATTARRGESAWAFFIRTLIGTNQFAWQFERQRLQREGKSVFHFDNRVLATNLIGLVYGSIYFALLGFKGVLIFVALALYGKLYVELVNYVEHYGLVRGDDENVGDRHSWNSYHPMSSWYLYNLPRHAQHHAKASLPFPSLDNASTGPVLPYGYMTMVSIAMIPPLWHRLMTPLVLDWDANFAKPGDYTAIARANAESGLSALQHTAKPVEA